MRKSLLIYFFLLLNKSIYCQYLKGTVQTGVSAVPIYDVFKLFPDNKIAGYGVKGNFHAFISKNLCVGFIPYFANINNRFVTYSYYGYISPGYEVTENIRLTGLNASLRYYVTKNKLSLYPSLSLGYGNAGIKSNSVGFYKTSSQKSYSIYTMMVGIGLDYHLTENIAIELDVPFTFLNSFPDYERKIGFRTITPTLGLEFFFK